MIAPVAVNFNLLFIINGYNRFCSINEQYLDSGLVRFLLIWKLMPLHTQDAIHF